MPVLDLRDFVDRIEVIYALSQLLRDADADLPGSQVLKPLMRLDRWWFALPSSIEQSPLDLMGGIMRVFESEPYEGLAKAIANGVRLSLAEAPHQGEPFERVDRMPLFRARREAEARRDEPVAGFVRHVIESWVLAQHTYWSVGRGLADARSRGKTILRLKVVLEEGGWSLAPGGAFMKPPQPTPDRLQTALALANECGFVQVGGRA